VGAVPVERLAHDLLERGPRVDLVVAVAAEDHEPLGSPARAKSSRDSSGGTSRSSSVVMRRSGRGAIRSTTHSALKARVSSTYSRGIVLERRWDEAADPSLNVVA
jgi:hypothetical protein